MDAKYTLLGKLTCVNNQMKHLKTIEYLKQKKIEYEAKIYESPEFTEELHEDLQQEIDEEAEENEWEIAVPVKPSTTTFTILICKRGVLDYLYKFFKVVCQANGYKEDAGVFIDDKEMTVFMQAETK